MSKEVTTQNTGTEVAQPAQSWAMPSGMNSSDIVIPKIACAQAMSKSVIDGDARFGDFMDSMTMEKLGDLKNPVNFIPFFMKKLWIVSKKDGGDWKFLKTEEVTLMNGGRSYFEVEDGVEYKNELVYNFYVLREGDFTLPYIISFKGSSKKAGLLLATQMYTKNARLGKCPAANVFALSGKKEDGEKGTYIVLSVSVVRDSTEEEMNEAFEWNKTLSSTTVKEHEESPELREDAANQTAF